MVVSGLCCCAQAFSSCGERGLLFVAVRGLLIAAASLDAEHRLLVPGLQELWHEGLVALQHVGSSRTRARTCVPCIGRRIFNHCTTREAPSFSLFLAWCSQLCILFLAFPLCTSCILWPAPSLATLGSCSSELLLYKT